MECGLVVEGVEGVGGRLGLVENERMGWVEGEFDESDGVVEGMVGGEGEGGVVEMGCGWGGKEEVDGGGVFVGWGGEGEGWGVRVIGIVGMEGMGLGVIEIDGGRVG